MIDRIKIGSWVQFEPVNHDEDDYTYRYWGEVIEPIEGGWRIKADIYVNEREDDQVTTVILNLTNEDILDVSDYYSKGNANVKLSGQIGPPIHTEEKLGEFRAINTEFQGKVDNLGELIIASDPTGLRDIAYFLLDSADALEQVESYDRAGWHSHYRSGMTYPDIIVVGQSMPEQEDGEQDV